MVLAITAVALSVWAVIRSGSPSDPAATGHTATQFDEAERSAATQRVCEAFETVRRGVSLNTNATAPGGAQDVAGGLAVAANARLALFGGGEYLLARIGPATPDDLAQASRNFAETLLDIGATSISGVPTTHPEQAERLRIAEEQSAAVAEQCEG
ncbi:hypothetical protein [Mycobacterium sp. SMC-4]|uniref:hypothetical protein n=1 Tax=Mycobacterium sp. SMC-4 TaxID=2857059 RepID=UPI0021B2483B|nr:hypothetical protein [Mycobacterium sp. SMC-4]UXA17592.1 hypothetical protein KXD98_23210 [Mycobacterium sp. SMC-4]